MCLVELESDMPLGPPGRNIQKAVGSVDLKLLKDRLEMRQIFESTENMDVNVLAYLRKMYRMREGGQSLTVL